METNLPFCAARGREATREKRVQRSDSTREYQRDAGKSLRKLRLKSAKSNRERPQDQNDSRYRACRTARTLCSSLGHKVGWRLSLQDATRDMLPLCLDEGDHFPSHVGYLAGHIHTDLRTSLEDDLGDGIHGRSQIFGEQ